MQCALLHDPAAKLAQHLVVGAYSMDSQSESEDDDYLAAAVAAIDAKQGKAKKVKHPHLRALRSKLGSMSRGKDKDGSGSTHAASPTSEQVGCPKPDCVMGHCMREAQGLPFVQDGGRGRVVKGRGEGFVGSIAWAGVRPCLTSVYGLWNQSPPLISTRSCLFVPGSPKGQSLLDANAYLLLT